MAKRMRPAGPAASAGCPQDVPGGHTRTCVDQSWFDDRFCSAFAPTPTAVLATAPCTLVFCLLSPLTLTLPLLDERFCEALAPTPTAVLATAPCTLVFWSLLPLSFTAANEALEKASTVPATRAIIMFLAFIRWISIFE